MTDLVQLGDIADIQSGGTPSRGNQAFYGGHIPWAKISDLETRDGFVTKTEEYITEEGLTAIRNRLFAEGTLLFAMYGSVGKMAIAGCDMTSNQAILGILPKDESKLETKYLRHFLASKQRLFEKEAQGVAQKNLSATYMRELKLRLPALKEQQRIAAILDKADAIRQKRQRAIDLADDLLRSVFLDMFGDPSANPKGWTIGTIRDLVDEVRYGTSSKAGEDGEFEILRMGNITYEGAWDFSSMKRIDIPAKDQEKYLVRKGDLLFNRTNSKELVGKTAVYREDKPMAFAGYLVRARPNHRGAVEYVSAYMNSSHGKQKLRSICKSIVGMANINAQEFQDIPIALAPVALQQEFDEKVKKVLVFRTKLEGAKSSCADLSGSLSQRAFAGEV